MTQQTTDTHELRERAIELSKDASKSLGSSLNSVGDKSMDAAAKKLNQLAEATVEKGQKIAKETKVPIRSEHVEATARRMSSAASYLSEHDPASVARDTESAMRAHPYRTLAVGIGAGWVIGKLTGRRGPVD